jgi:hypothetical protein
MASPWRASMKAMIFMVLPQLVHSSERAERRVDIAEFADWCAACGVDPLKAFADLQRRRGK